MSVVHCKHAQYDVYIGRPSPWGNPFMVGRDGARGECIQKFEAWFLGSKDKRAVWMREHVHELHGKTLGCWCAPQACHGDVLLQYADLELAEAKAADEQGLWWLDDQ